MQRRSVRLAFSIVVLLVLAVTGRSQTPTPTAGAADGEVVPKPHNAQVSAWRHKSYLIPPAGAGEGFTSAIKQDSSYQILLHPLGPEQDWTSLRIGLLNYGPAYAVKAMNLAITGPGTKPAGMGKDFATGFVPVISRQTTIKPGTDDSPTITWLGSWPAASSQGKRQVRLQIELAKGSPVVSWSGAAPGPKFLALGWILTGDEGLEKNLTDGFSTAGHNTFGQLPLLVLEFSGHPKPVIPLLCIGDSTLWGYGDGNQYSNPYGVPGRLANRWRDAGIYVAPVNFGRVGHPTDKFNLRLKAILSECDFGACLLQFGSINNVVRQLPYEQMQADWLVAEKLLNEKHLAVIPWLSPGMNAQDPKWWPAYKAQQDWMIARNANTVAGYRKRLCDMTSGHYPAGMNFSDGAHPSSEGYDCWEADSYLAIEQAIEKQGSRLK